MRPKRVGLTVARNEREKARPHSWWFFSDLCRYNLFFQATVKKEIKGENLSVQEGFVLLSCLGIFHRRFEAP